jgi:hypothetical protein
MSTLKSAATVVLACVLVGAMAGPTGAQKPFLAAVKEKFSLGEANAKCILCHIPKKGPNKQNLNDFGKAIQSDPDMKGMLNKGTNYQYTKDEIDTLLKVVDKLGEKDTDGDGASNMEEIKLGTFPGDAQSTPAKADLDKYRQSTAKKDKK